MGERHILGDIAGQIACTRRVEILAQQLALAAPENTTPS